MKKALFFTLLSILLISCDSSDDKPTINCDEIACTEIFISFSVTIKDASGVAIPLDSYEVVDQDTQEDLTPMLADDEFEASQQNGTYLLYSDITDTNTPGISRNILFKGFINGEEVIRSAYQVGRDCCHAALGKGELDLVLMN